MGAVWRCLGTYSGPRSAHALVMYMGAVCERDAAERAFAVYVTDALYYAPQGMRPSWRFAELFRRDGGEGFSAEEIVEGIAARFEEGGADEPA